VCAAGAKPLCAKGRFAGASNVVSVDLALVSGPGVTSPKSRPAGCRAGHAGLRSRSRLSSVAGDVAVLFASERRTFFKHKWTIRIALDWERDEVLLQMLR
jgi:hypothetical protein